VVEIRGLGFGRAVESIGADPLDRSLRHAALHARPCLRRQVVSAGGTAHRSVGAEPTNEILLVWREAPPLGVLDSPSTQGSPS
jgi:hypothetical protein